MPLPRVPKITRTRLDEGPPREVTYGVQDPFGLGPKDPWLRVQHQSGPKPKLLQRLDAGEWSDIGEGMFRIHAWRSETCAIVSQDQRRLFNLERDGSQTTLWEGDVLVEIQGGIWADNWMFAAAVLPDGSSLLILPSDTVEDPHTAARFLVLMDEDGEEIHRLELPERTDSAVKRGDPRRFLARSIHVGCKGRVAVIENTDLLAVGIYNHHIDWIGKTTTGGAVHGNGREVLVSTSLANQKFHWSRLEGLEELWERKRR